MVLFRVIIDFTSAILPDLAVGFPVLVIVCLVLVFVCLFVDGLWGVWSDFGGRGERRKREHLLIMKELIRDWREEDDSTPGVVRTHDLRFRRPLLSPAELRAQFEELLEEVSSGLDS